MCIPRTPVPTIHILYQTYQCLVQYRQTFLSIQMNGPECLPVHNMECKRRVRYKHAFNTKQCTFQVVNCELGIIVNCQISLL